jgi:hypothetical protein
LPGVEPGRHRFLRTASSTRIPPLLTVPTRSPFES